MIIPPPPDTSETGTCVHAYVYMLATVTLSWPLMLVVSKCDHQAVALPHFHFSHANTSKPQGKHYLTWKRVKDSWRKGTQPQKNLSQQIMGKWTLSDDDDLMPLTILHFCLALLSTLTQLVYRLFPANICYYNTHTHTGHLLSYSYYTLSPLSSISQYLWLSKIMVPLCISQQ